MIVTPIPLHGPHSLAARLRARGWTPEGAADAAGGVEPAAFLLEGLGDDALLALVRQSGQLGLDCLTGDGWAVLAGGRARLGALARPWLLPAPLQPVAIALGEAMPGEAPARWEITGGALALDRPLVMGILNTTPDSFSDGGAHADVDQALRRVEAMRAEGAALVDVGGESTRPGRTAVLDAATERARVVPVIAAIVRAHPDLPVSVDTMKAEVAAAALDAGARIVNDVSGGREDAGLLAAARGAGLVLMHSRGANLELASYAAARYADPAGDVLAELRTSVQRAASAGLARGQLVLDPGLGFAKTPAQTLAVLDGLVALRALGLPVLVGPSRKRFLGAVSGQPLEGRDALTATACALAFERGARLFRVHAVRATVDALALAAALRAPETVPEPA